jgi:multidrug efflux system membrane fusion protein
VDQSLKWVIIAQRFPVRVLLDDPPNDLVRIGATATVVVSHDGRR